MKKLARILSVAFALSLMTTGFADAAPARVQQRSSAQKLSGPKARAAIVRNRQAKGKSVNKLTVRKTQSHAKMQEYTAADGNGTVVKYQVKNDGSYARKAPDKFTQADARKNANRTFTRENGPNKGQFSGVRNSGITNSGNYKFRSKTNPGEVTVVDANSGKTRNYDPGKSKAKAGSSAKAAAR